MPPRQGHDVPPPPNWPETVTYLHKSRLSPSFPPSLLPLLYHPSTSPSTVTAVSRTTYNPRPIKHPPSIMIKRIAQIGHPANGQFGLFAKGKIKPDELIIPYLGVIHATLTPDVSDAASNGVEDEKSGGDVDEHTESDYDLSLLRLSASDIRNPHNAQTGESTGGYHVSIGVDAAKAGNAARFVNDYRGIKDKQQGGANAEFRLGQGENGELRMEIWSLKAQGGKNASASKGGIEKGEEILVSYGKGWWGARR
ncbi:hypothetical protein I317_03263 [Kwoniella heveanensis CBS 569]|uniref:SET domain-containing protein n=1 Tax=Kwoniella heveanensis BCC8398 TaxID=1296120 RepID=A0A1B9H0R1_9TREE|nr:hypothetical protein I316_01465 [Kwoniella heveanensis BCC8398]OCF42912.1 hypothetical protein I317_03263 [Kwoniella heveanensis CBS 569]